MKKRNFIWSVIFVGGLLVCTAILGVAGAIVALLQHDFSPGHLQIAKALCVFAFAGVNGFALGVAQVATASAAQLHGRAGREAGFWLAVISAGLCASVSVFGVHLGGSLLMGAETVHLDQGMLWMAGLGLAFVKPAMSYVTEECRAVQGEKERQWFLAQQQIENRRADEQREADRLAGIARAQAEAAARAAQETPQETPRATPGAARQFARALAREAPRSRRVGNQGQQRRGAVVATLPLTEDELRQAVESLTNRGQVVTLNSVAREASNLLGRPVSKARVERHPKRVEIFAEAAAA